MKKLFAVPLLAASLVPTTFLATMTLIGAPVVAVAQSPPATTSPLTPAGRSSPVAPSGKQAVQGPATLPQTLIHNLFQSRPAFTRLTGGFNTVFTTPVTCGDARACEFGFEDMIQVGNSVASSNRWAICVFVDGTRTPNCAFAGVVPIGGNLSETRVLLEHFHVATGPHTVQVKVYVDSPANLGYSEAIYRVYDPE